MVVIVVVASVMVYAWSTGLLGALMGGANTSAGKEALVIDGQSSYAFSNSTSVTIYIRNTGTASATLQTYYVKDANGNTYQYTSWRGPSIGPTAVVATTFNIGSTSCPNCVLTGSAFTFTAGNAYSVLVTTARGTQFTFSITR